MFRTSSYLTSRYLAIALSITALASATTPASAFSSQFNRVQTSLEAHHVLTAVNPPPRVTPGNSTVGSAISPIRK